MCGVFGIVGSENSSVSIYDGLSLLQHRGQDSAGITTCDNNTFFSHKGIGLVKDTFSQDILSKLLGNAGIGHVRYPTSGKYSIQEAHPIYVNTPLGISLCYNGNLTNTAELKAILEKDYHRHVNSCSDSEILINIFASALQKGLESGCDIDKSIFDAVDFVYEKCKGAYAVIMLIAGVGLLAFRDQNGIRPLIYGKKGSSYAISSESVAVGLAGYEVVSDIKAGEAVLFPFSMNNDLRHHIYSKAVLKPKTCLFEYIYFSRPDSQIDNISVYEFRVELGRLLAKQIQKSGEADNIDIVVPVPETSCHSALALAQEINKPYKEGLVKNRYIGRTFIMPGQKVRKQSVRRKLAPIDEVFKGKTVLLVDDSIVRGTTSEEIVQMVKYVGAKKVFFASIAPSIRYPNVYGIDIPDAKTLFAKNNSLKDMPKKLGVERVFFQEYSDIKSLEKRYSNEVSGFESSIFTGEYISGDITEKYLHELSLTRSNKKQEDALSEETSR